jgi:hypothetical protein
VPSSKPRRVYDPFDGTFDREQSHVDVVAREDARKGEWVGGVFVVSDKHYAASEDAVTVLGFGSDAIDRGRLQPIKGVRLA